MYFSSHRARTPFCATFARVLVCLPFAGCALVPEGTEAEQTRLAESGAPYARPPAERELPDLPRDAGEDAVLRRAFLANGDLEAAYFEWAAALAGVEQASSWPNTNVALGYSYLFSDARMKRFDRMTFSGGFDGMENLLYPGKVEQAGEVALDRARAAAERFRGAKFSLQERVLDAWAEFALAGVRVRIAREDLELMQLLESGLEGAVQAGASQEALLRARVDTRQATNRLATLESDVRARRAALNALLARAPDAPLEPPAALAEPRFVPSDDAVLLRAVAENNPELAELGHVAAGSGDALELARMQWIPDFNPTAAFTGNVSQALGGVLIVPTSIAEIRGSIRAAEAQVKAADSELRQRRLDRAGDVVGALVELRDAERRATFIATEIRPVAESLLSSADASFSAGAGPFTPVVDARRLLLELDLAIAEARTQRAIRLAQVERLAGFDVETLKDDAGTAPDARRTQS